MKKKFKKLQNSFNRFISYLICGDGRTRTAVQTPYPAAFYTLLLSLIVDSGMPEGRLSRSLSA